MLLVKLSVLKSLNSDVLMRIFSCVFLLLIAGVSVAEETTVQVGKHVAPSTDAATMIVSLLIVLLVVFVSAYLLKKFQITAQGGNQHLKVISSIHVGTKERVVIVQAVDKQLVLGVTATQVTLLDTLNKSSEITSATSEPFNQSFLNMLKKSSTKND